jgi:hypothetical protein
MRSDIIVLPCLLDDFFLTREMIIACGLPIYKTDC